MTNIDIQNQETFKVLLVGGFSNFYCVKKTVMDFFGSEIGKYDERFKVCFSENDRSYAISKGAALVADDIISINRLTQYSFGIEAFKSNGYELVKTDIEILAKKIRLSDAFAAHYFPQSFSVKGVGETVTIFRDGGSGNKIKLPLDQNIGDLFPNYEKHFLAYKADPEKIPQYSIGFSLNKNEIPTLHIKDIDGIEKKHPLNKLFEKMPAMII